jgi:hypothetical protein
LFAARQLLHGCFQRLGRAVTQNLHRHGRTGLSCANRELEAAAITEIILI